MLFTIILYTKAISLIIFILTILFLISAPNLINAHASPVFSLKAQTLNIVTKDSLVYKIDTNEKMKHYSLHIGLLLEGAN